jgi:hypothetical protein
MRITIKKLYKGNVELRDYQVNELIQKKESAEIYFNGDKMTIPYEELRARAVSKSKPQKSTIGTEDYCLIGYEWIPDPVEL